MSNTEPYSPTLGAAPRQRLSRRRNQDCGTAAEETESAHLQLEHPPKRLRHECSSLPSPTEQGTDQNLHESDYNIHSDNSYNSDHSDHNNHSNHSHHGSPEGSASQDTDDDFVLSEVHISPNNGRVDGRLMTSVFHIGESGPSWDYAVEIQHAMGTTLGGVGSQVWMGSFLLIDWMVSIIDQLRGSVALELGAGTGLASIALCLRTAVDKVFCTDYDEDVLANCGQNIVRNSHRQGHDNQQSTQQLAKRVLTRRCNWLMIDPMDIPEDSPRQFNWTAQDLEEWKENGAFIFAADVVYDDSLTDALVECLQRLLSEPLPETHRLHTTGRVAYLTMEKRYNFSLDQLDIVAQAHDYFVKKMAQSAVLEILRIDCSELARHCDYERSKDLELYKVVRRSCAPPTVQKDP